MDVNAPFRVLAFAKLGHSEVRFEPGDYAIENVFLYVPKILSDLLGSTDDSVGPSRSIGIEGYLRGKSGLEVVPVFPADDGPSDLLIVFLLDERVELDFHQRLSFADVAEFNGLVRRVSHEDRRSMLIAAPEQVKGIEHIWIVRSTVRLYGRYPIFDRVGEFAYFRKVAAESIIGGEVEFEERQLARLDGAPDGPDEVVEGRSQVVDDIPCGEAKFRGRMLKHLELIREMGVLPFTLHLSNDFVWFSREEGVSQYLQAVNAAPCPIKPALSKMRSIVPRVRHDEDTIDPAAEGVSS